MGDKAVARETARKAGVPITPGSNGVVESDQEALKVAKQIGYPDHDQGGRGRRRSRHAAGAQRRQPRPGLQRRRMEAEKAFNNGALYLEKLIENPHHIEFQILADQHGKIVHVGERDCSIQRRNQKLLEEAPSPFITPATRKAMGRAAIKLAQAVEYENAGTLEFLVDDKQNFYFMEMNTRIQVEHPVTEEVYGVDLVKAEHPEKFTPSAGKITTFNPPGGTGVRIDTAAYAEGTIPPYYDSLIAKLVVRGKDRNEAIQRMSRALGMFIVEGIFTTIPLHRSILADPDFRAGNFDTGFIERFLAKGK
jgi:acetyl-CoA carboxylase biotin carboxylase subunit